MQWRPMLPVVGKRQGYCLEPARPRAHVYMMRKNEIPLVICYLAAAAGLLWTLHVMGAYYV